jgi:hypothetical protein
VCVGVCVCVLAEESSSKPQMFGPVLNMNMKRVREESHYPQTPPIQTRPVGIGKLTFLPSSHSYSEVVCVHVGLRKPPTCIYIHDFVWK